MPPEAPAHPGTDHAHAPEAPNSPEAPRRPWSRRRWLVVGAVALAVLGVAAWFGIPYLRTALSTVSTDNAYVNAHTTFLAPRVAGQVRRVLVEDNQPVKKGQLLVELDPEPYRVQVELKQAALSVAESELSQARAQVRGSEAAARAARYNLQTAGEQVRQQVALLRADVAVLRKQEASRDLAQRELRRVEPLVARGAAAPEELDRARANLLTAEAAVAQARQKIMEDRVLLGIPAEPPNGQDLASVPKNVEQQSSTVRAALASLAQTAAALGLPLPPSEAGPEQVMQSFMKLAPGGDINKLLAQLVEEAPATKLARAKVEQARRDLENAQLSLSYTQVRADIDGVVSRRNVNPGNYVQVGQNLMAIQSLTDVWIDANYKETQLSDIRIGQPADVYVDAYPGRVFHGRVTGFSPSTGAAMALLPPENATGNFVKIVQRLPVRIELTDYDPEQTPLFIGLSCEPYVRVYEEATGPNAGQRLQAPPPTAQTSGPRPATPPGPLVPPSAVGVEGKR